MQRTRNALIICVKLAWNEIVLVKLPVQQICQVILSKLQKDIVSNEIKKQILTNTFLVS